jgi:aspartyl-tRNA(Asn)/glutamyl-tRNA(Gln) amidotransferase subunit C
VTVSVGRQDVERVARLARLELSPQQIEMFASQLDRIVEYVDTLARLDTGDIQPMMHAAEGAFLRDDEPADTLSRSEALEGAPGATGGYFRVPPVIE